ncbi:hypothetical protein [Paractinoplanes atraurantiacus]|uniref:Knr4/Smi1-like domain-containing protein n=1 Tax=Paractinoplanes atraurantiacus TaxID=1036182 RepID=A0A285J7U0_9ACTN|nr:hypothetical protein [Actinoplanes atraurantiacus]SNY55171.1 hypothetical protein SAMN05421748_11662 [Actinoplanes atraurantiacus]
MIPPVWNGAAFTILGEADVENDVAQLEAYAGTRLPAAVREWFRRGGDRRLAAVGSNLYPRLADVDMRFLEAGFLLLETDSQFCCRWVVEVAAADDDPPVFLVDPEDYACASRERYADRFSDYTFACAWDADLWSDDTSEADFDQPLEVGALDDLRRRLGALPVTYGWAGNRSCDAVHRFGSPIGGERVALAVQSSQVLWSLMSPA